MSSLTLPQIRFPSSLSRTRFWKKRTVTISDLDPQYRVTYLGNVLTGWAKGDGCLDKPLATLWRNHVGSDKPHIVMKVTITASGLKAVTKEHGLTEYWAHRITYCSADPSYPKVFCWIYRHEGRKMKQELRCHAVLCPSENKAKAMAERLQARLHQALIDFRKEKISRQNARLSLANTIYDNPTMPNRKIMLHTGSSNYRPPLDRGKSAPKLKVIEEVILEEDEEEEAPVLALCRSTSVPIPCFEMSSSSTTETSLASSIAGCDVGQLIDADEPSFQPMNREDNLVTAARRDRSFHDRLVASFDRDVFEEDDDDEEDEITNYLGAPPPVPRQRSIPPPSIVAPSSSELDSVEVDSAASVSPDSNVFSTRSSDRKSSSSLRSRKEDEEDMEDDDDDSIGDEALGEERLGALKLSEQDAISDESGYSEDSNPSTVCNAGRTTILVNHFERKRKKEELLSGKTTVVMINPSSKKQEEESDRRTTTAAKEDESPCDLTVHSALISDFSSTERLRYLDKTRRHHRTSAAEDRDFLHNRITEFCINI